MPSDVLMFFSCIGDIKALKKWLKRCLPWNLVGGLEHEFDFSIYWE